jgi:hypothetical protein
MATTSFGAIKQSYVVGNFALELEGSPAGLLNSVAGGFAQGNIVEESESPDYFIKKHLEDPPGYTDITIEFGSSMSGEVFRWIKDVLNGSIAIRKSGAIVALNYNGVIMRRLDFSNAQITRITLPSVNAASAKAPATIRLTLTPENTAISSPGGTYKSLSAKGTKALVASNFRMSSKGFDASGVVAVTGIDIPIPRTARPDAACSECQPDIPRINYPNIDVVITDATSATWLAWHQTFVIAGQHNDADEKSATLDYLDATLKSTLMSISFEGLGITTIVTDQPGLLRATLYVERITLTLTPP